jgi:hypothetical protein
LRGPWHTSQRFTASCSAELDGLFSSAVLFLVLSSMADGSSGTGSGQMKAAAAGSGSGGEDDLAMGIQEPRGARNIS